MCCCPIRQEDSLIISISERKQSMSYVFYIEIFYKQREDIKLPLLVGSGQSFLAMPRLTRGEFSLCITYTYNCQLKCVLVYSNCRSLWSSIFLEQNNQCLRFFSEEIVTKKI